MGSRGRGQSPANNLCRFLYDITGPFIQPIQELAGARTLDSGGIFYPETAIAMGVYAIATLLVLIAMNIVAGMITTADTEPVVQRRRLVRGWSPSPAERSELVRVGERVGRDLVHAGGRA